MLSFPVANPRPSSRPQQLPVVGVLFSTSNISTFQVMSLQTESLLPRNGERKLSSRPPLLAHPRSPPTLLPVRVHAQTGLADFGPRFHRAPWPRRPPCLYHSWVLKALVRSKRGTSRAQGKRGICIPLPGAIQILPAIPLTNPYQGCPWRSLW